MLSIPLGTVMSRISRGRRMLFESLRASPSQRSQPSVASRQAPVGVADD
jgi:hypothetical protein